ncbi:MAG: hypothetical protein IIX36_01810 [Clostridia bacterium]|nr:hypothetical protein [Clostridia bacterium]
MKKIVAVLLTALMLFSLCSAGALAAAEIKELTEYPVIMVPGYSSSELYRLDENGEVVHVWGDAFGQAMPEVEANLGGIIADMGTFLLAGDVDPIAKRLGEGFQRIFGDMKTNPDGSSYYDIKNYINTPEESCYATLMEKYPEGRFQAEAQMMSDVIEKIDAENCFVFSCDFRMGAVECANKLKNFIDDVLAYTGKDKVNILAVSHGGQVSGTYLTLYGAEGKVNNAVLTVPALGGAGIAYDAFNVPVNGFDFGDVALVTFIEHGFVIEEDFHYLVQAGQLGFLDDLADALIPYVMPIMGTWGSMWDFVPLEYYETMKAQRLDETENAKLIAQSDYMHYSIMSPDGENYFAKGFKKAQDVGTNIYILAGYDIQIVTGMAASSDAIITTAASTGATCAPFGKRFADGYTQKVDTGFYQVSPSMTVDASTCYLPEHTWLIEDYHHGMTYWDEYTKSLMYTLLLNDESYDVHSFEEYPQFHATTNMSHSIQAAFDNCTEGYLTSDATKLVVTNLSDSKPITVLAANVYGADVELGFFPLLLLPGKSASIKIKGDIPEVSRKNFEISLSYVIGSVTLVGERTFEFTLMNGEAAEYDAENPFVDADPVPAIDSVLKDNEKEALEKFGAKGLAGTIYNIVMYFIRLVDTIINFFK